MDSNDSNICRLPRDRIPALAWSDLTSNEQAYVYMREFLNTKDGKGLIDLWEKQLMIPSADFNPEIAREDNAVNRFKYNLIKLHKDNK